MKQLGLFLITATVAATMATGAFAQDLDTVSVVDQLNSGSRGDNDGSGTYGASATDGSEFEDYSGLDATVTPTTSVRYINTWGSAGQLPAGTYASQIESPVVDITVSNVNPDRGGTNVLPAIVANTRPGATGGNTAVLIGDDGGYNSLFWGDSDDSDYYAEVDIFCPTLTVGSGFEEAGLAVRAASDGTTRDFSYSCFYDGSYAIVYNYQAKTIKAGTYTKLVDPDPIVPVFTQFGATTTLTDSVDGWHTFRIEANGTDVTFLVDGASLGTLSDSSVTNGRPGIWYREASVSSSLERQGVFDQLRSGPSNAANVNDWNLY